MSSFEIDDCTNCKSLRKPHADLLDTASPLDDPRKSNTIRSTMKNGRMCKGDTLNEVWSPSN